ncbi:MAG: dialkylresorcinol condensing enzyme [Desulfosarcina sp.]|nr:dialkylresorcinol condensing enzyme [Desulfobacterales bacterium]
MAKRKNILVITYSQSGQLDEIVASVLEPLQNDSGLDITIAKLIPDPAYPFPWDTRRFCDVFPESFQEIPCRLAPLDIDPDAPFDLVVLAYQVWFLSPSIPMSAFLQSEDARRIIAHRPVVTLIGCRNMWLRAQEKVKVRIAALGGRLTGNIVLTDRSGNLTGVVTIAYWMLTGRKERFLKIFPRPGISAEDIRAARRFGIVLRRALKRVPVSLDQAFLNAIGALKVEPTYMIFEKRISRVFAIWSRFIRAKGGPGRPARQGRVRAFFFYLLTAIVVLAPVAAILSRLILRVRRDKLRLEKAYYESNRLRPG